MKPARVEAPRREAPAWLPQATEDVAAPATQPPLRAADALQAQYGNSAVMRSLSASASCAPPSKQAATPTLNGSSISAQEADPAEDGTPHALTPAPIMETARADAKAQTDAESDTGEEASVPLGGAEDKETPPRARERNEPRPEAPVSTPGVPGLPEASATANVKVDGSTPAGVLASLAQFPPSQFARGISEAEAASKTALANQAHATRTEIPELKAPTGMPSVGASMASTSKAGTTAVPATAEAGAPAARTPLKPGAGPQIVKTPDVLPQRPSEPTRLSGPEQPTGDPTSDAKMAGDAQAELATVAVDDHGIPQSAGQAQPIKLDKEADPAQIDQEDRKHAQDVGRAAQAERQETNRDFGDGAIAPRPDDSMIVTKVGIHGSRAGKLKAGPAGPSDAELSAGFDASLGPELNRRVLAKSAEYDSEEQRFESDKQAAHDDARAEIASLQGDTTRQQLDCKRAAQKEVGAQREQWRREIGEHQAGYEKAAGGAVAETRGKVAHEKADGERKIAGHYDEANRKIAKEHEDAKSKEDEARKKAKKKSSGFFGWIRSKAAALIDWLKDAVNFIYDNVRKAVKAALDFVKEAVLKVIDLVRDAVVGLIKGLAGALKLLVNVALLAFPETRRRINAKIDAGVQTATQFVNDAADTLKKGVAAALDFLAGAIDKLLGLIQSIYSGILTFVSMVVSGEFEEIIRRLGYLVSAAKTVPDVFEQAALEELLGGNLDEPLSLPELQFAAANNLLPASSATEGPPGAAGPDALPKPPYSDENVAVDDVANDFELSPEMEAELLNELEGDAGGTLEFANSEDRSRSIGEILKEARGESGPTASKEGADEETEKETGAAMADGLTPMQRAKVKWEMMKDGIAKWWSDNWGKVILAATAAIVGFIALNIVTGGGVMAVLTALMPVLTPLFIGVTVVTLASHAKDYVEKGWEGQIRPAGKSLAHGLAAGAIELISWLTFKAGGAALRGAKALAKGGAKLVQAGARGAKNLTINALKAGKALVERGRIVLQGIGKTKIGKLFSRLAQLGDELLKRLRFRKFRIVLEGRRFRLEGFINPWVLLATGTVKHIETPKGAGRLEVGDRLKIAGQDAVVVGIKGAEKEAASNFVKQLKGMRKPARADLYKDLTSGRTRDIAKENARLIIFNAENTAELRKGISGAQLPGYQAHHVIPREVARNPAVKKFLDKIKFALEDGATNGIMLPPNGAAAAGKWANAAVHFGSHGTYSSKILARLQAIELTFKAGGQTPQALTAATKQVAALQDEVKQLLMNSKGLKVNDVL